MTDLLAFTAELVDIPSVSHDERAITDHLEQLLRAVPWLEVERVGHNVAARTVLGRFRVSRIPGPSATTTGPWTRS